MLIKISLTLVLCFQISKASDQKKVAQVACRLLGSCIERSTDLFATCDQILRDEKPLCWNETRSVISQLRKQTKAENRHVIHCLNSADPLSGVLTQSQSQECESMLAHLPHSWSGGPKARVKRAPPPKGWVKFYMCIQGAQRTTHMCRQLAKCCPKERKCKWEEALQPTHAAALQLKVQLFETRQSCLNKLMSDQGKDSDYWGFLEGQDIWQL